MNNIYKLLFLLLAAFSVSCSKDDDGSTPLRDYNEQYTKDLDTIDEFIDTHFMTVSPDYDVTFTKITAQTPGTSIRNQMEYPLDFKMVTKDDIEYKVYYIKLREGDGERPSSVDSIHVGYRGNLISLSQFDYAQSPVWFALESVVSGWQEIIPFFKTGTYDTSEGPNPVAFTGYGAGVMFLPSALAYYGQPRNGIPAYSSLIFSFKLYELRYRDQDRDGVLSKDEVEHPGDDPRDYDLDNDDIPNMYDIDDDGDHFLTKVERERPHGENDPIYYYPFDGAATDDPLTPYDDRQGVPDCSGDFLSPTRLRKYLDPNCH